MVSSASAIAIIGGRSENQVPYTFTSDWAFVSDYTYIAVPADKAGEIFGGLFAQDRGRWSMYPYQLNGVVRNMDNVLVVPKKAVTEKNGNTYVSVVKENGEIVAQRFVAGGYNANNYWVVEGLTEGMEICLE